LAATNQVLLLRDGVGETVNVAAGHAAAGNSNAEQISIYGGTGADTINLASGSDTVYLGTGSETVVLGGAKNSVFAGGGSSVVQSVAAYAGASVVGTSTGSLALDITSAGTVTLNAADTDVSVQLGAVVKLTLGKLGFITVNGGNGGDTIVAGAANQTLIGGTSDVLTGFAGGGDVFSGASAALSGDTLGNWTTGDVIDLTDMSASATLSYAGTTKSGKLTVSDGVHSSVISFSGSFTAANFGSPISDGQNGVLIGYHG
jgi:Ca2+-binding RTX toxin-like protein